jgi:DNA modification methylase
MTINHIHHGDARKLALELEDNSVHCIVTSPPYFGLRDYQVAGQIGLEETPEAFIAEMVSLFSILKQKLRDDGTLWLNIGDSYAGSWGGQGTKPGTKIAEYAANGAHKRESMTGSMSRFAGLKPKDLIGIPWALAFALRADGWYLRQDIIWHKPNPMPESVYDRCTKSHEYLFLLSKSRKYYYDYTSIMTKVKSSTDYKTPDGWDTGNGAHGSFHKNGREKGRKSGNLERKNGFERGTPLNTGSNVAGSVPWEGEKANKRSVWTVTTQPFQEAHFATFPQKLIVDCIKAGCPADGTVLDPFMGAGTTGLVARKLHRNYIGFELNEDYVTMANARLSNDLGLFK